MRLLWFPNMGHGEMNFGPVGSIAQVEHDIEHMEQIVEQSMEHIAEDIWKIYGRYMIYMEDIWKIWTAWKATWQRWQRALGRIVRCCEVGRMQAHCCGDDVTGSPAAALRRSGVASVDAFGCLWMPWLNLLPLLQKFELGV